MGKKKAKPDDDVADKPKAAVGAAEPEAAAADANEQEAGAIPSNEAAAGAAEPAAAAADANGQEEGATPSNEAGANGEAGGGDATVQMSPEEEAEEAAVMKEFMKCAEEQDFDRAAALLRDRLKRRPEDHELMHNLAVILTEQCSWLEAEEMFSNAFELQQKSGKVSLATMYGFGTVLTEQGGTMKLLQGEALFRDCLEMAAKQDEKGVLNSYRSFVSLCHNLEKQKRWPEAVEVWRATCTLASAVFGDENDKTQDHKFSLARAEKLAKWQKGFRTVLWVVTLAAPIACAWAWKRAGLGGPWQLMMGGFGASPGTGSSLGHEPSEAGAARA